MTIISLEPFEDSDALIWPCYSGNVEEVRTLIESGKDVNSANNRDFTPLLAATRRGHYPVARLLLENSADVNRRPQSSDDTPLLVAAGAGFIRLIELFSDHGAPIDHVHTAFIRGNIIYETPLMRAAYCRHGDAVKCLKNLGADPNYTFEDGLALVHYLLTFPSPCSAIAMLIDEGADQDKDSPRGTPLHIAVSLGDVHACTFFLEKGSSINSISNGLSPLHVAISNSYIDIIEVFLQWARDIRFEAYFNASSIIHLIYSQGFQQLAFADTRIRDHHGRTLLEYARHHGVDDRIFHLLYQDEQLMLTAATHDRTALDEVTSDAKRLRSHDDDSLTVVCS